MGDNQPDGTAVGDVSSINIRSSPSPMQNIVRTRSGQVVHRLLRLRIDVQRAKIILTSPPASLSPYSILYPAVHSGTVHV